MINIRPLIESRIRAQTTGFMEVSGAADLSSILGGRVVAPGCYIFHDRDIPADNKTYGKTQQKISVQVAIIIVVRNHNDGRGADSSDICFVLRESVKTALTGWIPATDVGHLDYVSGELASFSNGFYIWKETYKSTQYLSS